MKVQVIEAKNEELDQDFCGADDVIFLFIQTYHIFILCDNNSIVTERR